MSPKVSYQQGAADFKDHVLSGYLGNNLLTDTNLTQTTTTQCSSHTPFLATSHNYERFVLKQCTVFGTVHVFYHDMFLCYFQKILNLKITHVYGSSTSSSYVLAAVIVAAVVVITWIRRIRPRSAILTLMVSPIYKTTLHMLLSTNIFTKPHRNEHINSTIGGLTAEVSQITLHIH